jgi:putative hydrolase of the HAD superfamily
MGLMSEAGESTGPIGSGAPGSAAPEAFLFDLDGVLRVFGAGETAEIERRHGLAEGALDEAAYAPERYGPALVGEVSDDDWRASVVAALVPAYGVGPAIEAVSDWSARVGRVNAEVADAVAGIRAAGVPVALVVNGTTRLELDLVVLGLAESVDAVVNSARTGVAKPDARIYEIAAGILTARPQRCVYVGAAHRYVAGAERVGMKGHLFDGIAGLRTMLAERLPTG